MALIGSSLGVFQWSAYQPSITMMVPKKHFGRASGMMQAGDAVRGIIAPLLAGALYVSIGLTGILAIDFVTYFFAIGALLMVRIPQPKIETEEGSEQRSMLKDALFGWHYLVERRPLLAMLLY